MNVCLAAQGPSHLPCGSPGILSQKCRRGSLAPCGIRRRLWERLYTFDPHGIYAFHFGMLSIKREEIRVVKGNHGPPHRGTGCSWSHIALDVSPENQPGIFGGKKHKFAGQKVFRIPCVAGCAAQRLTGSISLMASEDKTSFRMVISLPIICGWRPGIRRMAGCAVLSKHTFMYPGFLMTLDAIRGCKPELVVLMAVLTGGRQVFSG